MYNKTLYKYFLFKNSVKIALYNLRKLCQVMWIWKPWLIFCLSLCWATLRVTVAQSGRNKIPQTYNDFLKLSARQGASDFKIRYPKINNDGVRRQHVFPERMPFPCANSTAFGTGRSAQRPTSVHQLRPGDIDVIGAMGDSLVAGNGAMEQWAMGTMIENRGVSWAAGGQGTWRDFLTVPNILKMFNPNLIGYSTGTGEFLSQHSQMNVAFPVAADADALHQAKILVNKMKQDSKVNFKEDWKMITVFFGQNDICSAQCFGPAEATPIRHGVKLMQALDYLQDHLPRTFVNLIPVLDPSVSVRVKRSLMCRFFHTLFCSCFHQFGMVDEMAQITSMTRDYQYAEEQLVFSGRYDKKSDFTVVIQPFMKYFNAPMDPKHLHDEVIDISYITHDCFHFSQKGHALTANLLWNNLLEPVGSKSISFINFIMEKFRCPTEKAPYLYTPINSRRFYETGQQ